MPINLDLVGTSGSPERRSWNSDTCLLYAISVGVGADDPSEGLAFTTENSVGVVQRVLPSTAVVIGPPPGGNALIDLEITTFAGVLHGEQGIVLHREIPVAGALDAVTTVTGIYDKGSGALVATTTECTIADTDEPLFDLTSSLFFRGEGGFGGPRGERRDYVVPERRPDHTVRQQTRRNQALLYRLNGDRNPLHADPEFAAAVGFEQPILHGLGTYGFVCRALLETVCVWDPSLFDAVEGRFRSPVLPGEWLVTSIWADGDDRWLFETRGEDGRVVLDRGRLRTSSG